MIDISGYAKCSYCPKPATVMVVVKDGDYIISTAACSDHTQNRRIVGYFGEGKTMLFNYVVIRRSLLTGLIQTEVVQATDSDLFAGIKQAFQENHLPVQKPIVLDHDVNYIKTVEFEYFAVRQEA